MRAVVFIGPSLDQETAGRELDAEFLPPVKRGDIGKLLARDEPPVAIGIVDGRFLQSLSISPKEVLAAIDKGIAVYGASSMGALRAAECAPYGMVGIGKIYDEYASGRIDADDEVAIVYDEGGLGALSEPMVNMRFAVATGLAQNAFAAETGEAFLRIAKQLYFPQRTVPMALVELKGEITEDEHARISRFFAESAPDTKREDALLLLRTMCDDLERLPEKLPREETGLHEGSA